MSATLLERPPPAVRRPMPSARAVAFALVALSGLLRLAYLAAEPLDLSPDEAHYWDWSRRLDWSYYSKGPLVAWLIRASTELFGHTAFAVRLPAVGCHVLLLLAVRELAARHFGERTATVTVLLGLTIPPLAAGAVLMTIDAPFLAAWAWAAVLVQRAMDTGKGWTAAGVTIAVGVLAKYTMLLFPVCVGVYLFAARGVAPATPQAAPMIRMTAIGLVGLVPIVGWNAANDWIGVRHLFTQAGGESASVRWVGPLEYLGGQFALFGGYWFCVVIAAAWHFRTNRRLALLWWLSVLPIGLFLLASFRAKVQPNWPAAGYLTGFVLAVGWLTEQLRSPMPGYRRLVAGLLVGGTVVGLTMTGVAYFPRPWAPLFARFAPAPSADDPAPVRKVDPTARVRGWKYLASQVDELRERVAREDGQEPLIAAMVWNVPGELAFYCRGNPAVYSFGPALADRTSQYDVWRPNPVADAQAFAGRTFVYVGETMPDGAAVFETTDGPHRVAYRENGVTVGFWQLWVCRGFKGFPSRRPHRY